MGKCEVKRKNYEGSEISSSYLLLRFIDTGFCVILGMFLPISIFIFPAYVQQMDDRFPLKMLIYYPFFLLS